MKEDNNLKQLFEEASFFLLSDDEFREKNCKIFWNYLANNSELIQFAIREFEKLPESVLKELHNDKENQYKTSRSLHSSESILDLYSIITNHSSFSKYNMTRCEVSEIEEVYRRFACLMYVVNTIEYKINGKSLFHFFDRAITKELEIKKIDKDKSRFSIRVFGGLAEENKQAFEELDFSRINGNRIQHEAFAKAESPTEFDDSIINKITFPYIGSLIVPNDIVSEMESIFNENEFKIKKE
jgi:hypothetical protein